MSRFILLEFCLLLLCAIWLAEAPHNTIKITNMVNNIFNNKGWINLNDVEKDSLWKNLNEEYKNTSFSKNKNQRLYDYLSKKLYHKFLTIIYDKYHNLGFDYDLKTKKIFTREQLKSIEIDSNLQLNSECGIKLKLENEDSYERESDNQSKNNEIIELIKFLNEGLNPDSILEEHD
ncbi:uncharacterized protein LOC126894683 isoform X2 [Daktulosphaira vitifoliae]|uniref:uncharacterized protein LOC126894683 isoform X2 n=1 Tax=Daktulosphaira vitifoliae TaxID=58002 RepID=UPI0021AA9875|nr:uncharacterized protein LOC126894683 isoform X2 [Daktulosphaira vitifoliae]